MTSFLRQSTQVVVVVGPYLDATDGVTEETGLAGAGTEVSKSPGAAFGTGPTLGTHDAEGWYPVTLTTDHTDTVGRFIIKGHAPATHLPVWHEFVVVEEAVFDRDYAAAATGVPTGMALEATLGTPTDTDVSTDIAAVQAATDAIPTTAMRGTDGVDTATMRGTDGANTTTPPTAAVIADAVQDEPIEDHDNQGTVGWATALAVYPGPDGPGIYVDSGAANTNTVVGTDGTEINPVSTFAAARTIADALGLKIYYLEGNSDITLAATHEDWEFIGIGSVADNVLNLGSQDVDRSLFRNLTIEGTQGGTGRITARDCALQDPGPGATTLHIFAERCGIVDNIEVDTSADNVFDECFSLAASGVAPIITATGAAGSILISHYGGKLELAGLSASHNIELDGHGHITFNADCNVNANMDIHGVWDVTDNTAGMSDLVTMPGLVNMTKINAEADTAISDAALATAANLATVDAAAAAIQAVTDLLPDSGALNDLAAILADLANETDGLGALKTLLDAIPTTAMRGTDGVDTATMRGTDSAALASVATEARLAELDAANLPADIDAIPTTAMRGTDSAATEAKQDVIDGNVDLIKAKTDPMTYTKANELNANTKSLNDSEVTGAGTAGDPWDGP